MEVTKKSGDGRILLLKRDNKILTLLYQNNRLLQAGAYSPENATLDCIYIGKVKNVVQNIQAAFIEYMPGKQCFLSINECHKPLLVNREYDGRILAGDEIVIQITSEKQKTKEAGASANLSFPGKYIVLTRGKTQIGYSPKLSVAQKNNLKEWMKNKQFILDAKERYGIIFRTNVGSLDDFTVLEKELLELKAKADNVIETAAYRTCYSCLYQSLPPYLKNLQDFYAYDYEKILTDDKELYQEASEYLACYQPGDLEKLSYYEDHLLPLSKLYSVESRLAEALDRKVWMKSGGYLVIDRAEALTCIDVNTGKYIGKKSKSETCFQINIEAAEEIGIQLCLRNISGIIIIDFINMDNKEQEKALLEHLRKVLAKDSVKTVLVDMTPLGLVEVTRKKEKKSLWEQLQA